MCPKNIKPPTILNEGGALGWENQTQIPPSFLFISKNGSKKINLFGAYFDPNASTFFCSFLLINRKGGIC